MKIVILDGYSANPGDLTWAELEKMGDLTVYDRTPCDDAEIARRIGDAEIVLTSDGISGRIAKSAVNVLRREGVKAGLIRPITVNPFPVEAYDHIDYGKVKGILDVEMSIPAQFVKDVEVAVRGRCPIETCLCSGGNIMSREAIVDSVKRIMEGK